MATAPVSNFRDAKTIVDSGAKSADLGVKVLASIAQKSYDSLAKDKSSSTVQNYVQNMARLAQAQGIPVEDSKTVADLNGALREALKGAGVGSHETDEAVSQMRLGSQMTSATSLGGGSLSGAGDSTQGFTTDLQPYKTRP